MAIQCPSCSCQWNALFGGARPRELVLKERGVDDVVINNLDVGVEHSNRTEIPTARTKKLPDRYAEKNEGAPAPYDRWTGKKPERKEQRVEVERVNAQPQRRNWRSDNRRNVQEVDKQQVSERPPSPKTWRKPVEEPKSSADTGSTSHGKAASAVDLAQAFSRSVSDPRVNDRFSGQRGSNNNGRTQVPFSRLVGPTPTPRPQINGY
ncbi:hypothetical protein PIB30_046286 [Stylosanthes scabra]|uniref:Uncharacterized protein n=1 Tax=Stylosanthes scabra TaxID=79078 RepID=A0ABU6QG51_9FABA|nr:hypothetical protein [Stylosanthes scabra]